jgi:hypothetical protein
VNVQVFCTLYIVQSINHLYVACRPEPESVRLRNQFRQAVNRFWGSLKDLQIRALYNVGNRYIRSRHNCKHLFLDVKKTLFWEFQKLSRIFKLCICYLSILKRARISHVLFCEVWQLNCWAFPIIEQKSHFKHLYRWIHIFTHLHN